MMGFVWIKTSCHGLWWSSSRNVRHRLRCPQQQLPNRSDLFDFERCQIFCLPFLWTFYPNGRTDHTLGFIRKQTLEYITQRNLLHIIETLKLHILAAILLNPSQHTASTPSPNFIAHWVLMFSLNNFCIKGLIYLDIWSLLLNWVVANLGCRFWASFDTLCPNSYPKFMVVIHEF